MIVTTYNTKSFYEFFFKKKRNPSTTQQPTIDTTREILVIRGCCWCCCWWSFLYIVLVLMIFNSFENSSPSKFRLMICSSLLLGGACRRGEYHTELLLLALSPPHPFLFVSWTGKQPQQVNPVFSCSTHLPTYHPLRTGVYQSATMSHIYGWGGGKIKSSSHTHTQCPQLLVLLLKSIITIPQTDWYDRKSENK